MTHRLTVDTYALRNSTGGYRRNLGQLFNDFFNNTKFTTVLLATLAIALQFCAPAVAQRARFDDFFASQSGGAIPAPARTLQSVPGVNPSIITTPPAGLLQQPNFAPGSFQSPVLAPQNGVPSLQFPTFGAPAGATPSFDPYSAQNQNFPIFPRGNQPGFQPLAPTNPQAFAQPQYGNQQLGTGYFGNRQFQGNGTNWQPAADWTQQAWQSFRSDFLPRLFERPRARQTYLYGSGGNELNINDIELATTATLPNFLQGPTPLKITPGFVFHFWNGPDSVAHPAFDLPARAYSSYLSFDHITDPSKVSGFENNLTIGYYSDFDNTSSDAIRITAKLLGWYRVNQYTISKFGVEYLDRVNVKLLPAFGVYLTPNADMKFDLYFPKSKLSHRIPNINNYEAWAYVGGEYGGGSWAINRRDGTRDQVDINDVRAYAGIEWMGPQRVTGFFELGYVFERELVYRSNALNTLDLQDTLMIRSGLAF
ncbi:MAG: hypothetical protein ACI814_001309 [Mariniblastus sp.]